MVNGVAYDAAQMVRLADMPPLPVLRAQLLGLLNTPATRLASSLAAPARQLATVVKAYAEKRAGGGLVEGARWGPHESGHRSKETLNNG